MADGHRLRRRGLLWIIAFVLLCFAARIYAPIYIEDKINDAISESPGIEGKIDDVGLAFWRGAYQINGIETYSVDQDIKRPLFFTETLDLSILWSALLRGEIVAQMHFVHPRIHFLDNSEKAPIESVKAKDSTTWINLANRLAPFSIDRIDIINGEVEFELLAGDKHGLFAITDIQGTIKNITNIRERNRSEHATADATGLIQNQSKLEFNGSYNPFEKSPTFDADVSMQRLEVKRLDRFIRYYLPVDFEAGEVDMAMELVSEKGQVHGYVKVGVYDLDIFSWKQDAQKQADNPLQLLLEALAGGLSTLLENDKSDMVATRIPIEGDISDPEIPLFDAIAGLFRNALIEAYDMKVEDLFSFNEEPEED